MAKKAKKKRKASKPRNRLNWHDEGQEILKGILKKSGKTSTILVLSRNGDLIFREGKKTGADLTAVGALMSSIQAASHQLENALKTKASFIQFGDAAKGFWVEEISEWIIVGIKIKRSSGFQKFYKHLKKKQKHLSSGSTFEALEGLTEAAVDAAFK